jgi:hypothetical protein
MRRMAIPCTLRDDQEVVGRMRERYGEEGWIFIPNTLHLETLYVSRDLASHLMEHPRCEVEPNPLPLSFDAGGLLELGFQG